MHSLLREIVFKILEDNTDFNKTITVLECSGIVLEKSELEQLSLKFNMPLMKCALAFNDDNLLLHIVNSLQEPEIIQALQECKPREIRRIYHIANDSIKKLLYCNHSSAAVYSSIIQYYGVDTILQDIIRLGNIACHTLVIELISKSESLPEVLALAHNSRVFLNESELRVLAARVGFLELLHLLKNNTCKYDRNVIRDLVEEYLD